MALFYCVITQRFKDLFGAFSSSETPNRFRNKNDIEVEVRRIVDMIVDDTEIVDNETPFTPVLIII